MYTTCIEGGVAFGWEGVGIESHEWVGGVLALQGVGEGEEPGQVVGVGDEGGPHWALSARRQSWECRCPKKGSVPLFGSFVEFPFDAGIMSS